MLPFTNRLTTVKYIASRSGGISTKIMLHEVDLTLEQLAQQISLSTASGFDATDLPTDYPGKISYNYGIENNRIFCFVANADTSLAMGHGVSQSSFTDANAIHIAVCTGQGASGDVFTTEMYDFLAHFISDLLYNVLSVVGAVSLTTNLLRRTGSLSVLDMDNLKDLVDDYQEIAADPVVVPVALVGIASEYAPEQDTDDPTPTASVGDPTILLGAPDEWIQIPWASAPDGILLVPAYIPQIIG